jgi:hypothetical protein
MKGKLTKLMMVAMMLVTMLGLTATALTVSTTTVAAATDKWSRMDLPTTLNYQMFPDSDIWDLTAADDGTLFALVEDTTGAKDVTAGGNMSWDGKYWAVYPTYSDIAVFKSTDGGYNWELMWHLPNSETGAPLCIVPQPGYVNGDSTKDVVFLATGTRLVYNGTLATDPTYGNVTAGGLSEGNIYRSQNAGADFTRATPRCPAVTLAPHGQNTGGTITSMDVVENQGFPGTYMAIVGVSSLNTSLGGATTGCGEGVYSWNQNNTIVWLDLQISNAQPGYLTPPQPGTMPAGNGLDVLQVIGSPNFVTDGLIAATVNDIVAIDTPDLVDPANEAIGTYVCFYDANDGIWGGDIDSPTNTITYALGVPAAPWLADYAGAAAIDTGTDFNNITSAFVFVGIDGSFTGASNDLWRVRGLATVTGPSTVATCNVLPLLAGLGGGRISDVMINAECSNPQTAVYVGCEFPTGQAQVLCVYNTLIWPGPVPSMKPTSGAWPVLITNAAGTPYAAGGGDGFTTGGVHKMYQSLRGPVWNGIGLMDDIAVSENIPGLNSLICQPAYGWCRGKCQDP